MKLKICLIILGIFIHQSTYGAYPPPTCADSAGFLPINGAFLHYELSGPNTGQTIVFLPPYITGAEIYGCYRNFFCAQGYQVLLLDTRGQGLSRVLPPNPNAPYTITQSVSDLNASLAALGINTPVVLVAWGTGGAIAQIYAETYPAQVSKLILIDSTPRFQNSATWSFGQIPFIMPYEEAMARLTAQTNNSLPGFAAFVGLEGFELCDIANPELALTINQAALTTVLTSDPQAQTSLLNQQVIDFDGRATLSSITAPTLIIYGCDNPYSIPPASFYMNQNIPNSMIVGIPKYSSNSTIFTTDFTANLILNFLQGNPITNSTGCNGTPPACSSCVVPLS